MAEIKRLRELLAKLRDRAARSRRDDDAVVAVGYTASYAIYVHENLESRHAEGTQAKFLEQPAREIVRDLGEIIATAMRKGKTLAQGLILAGLRLQRESQQLVPIDTGNLRASAFTRLEK